ncbi:hypothetical protein PAXINDRAFT_7091 [Paxillus involutus ATCC 200175]|nr:hypothetical protein PAXINDRAFT_7091 [Paxillus involutus ATCC 200175]
MILHAQIQILIFKTISSLAGSGETLIDPSQAAEPTSRSELERSRTSTATPKTNAAATTNPPATIETAVASRSTTLPIPAASQVSDNTSKTWRIIGIATIAVMFVAASIACAMFFDCLWGFVKDIVRGKTRFIGLEE